jgi:hypothetical protein
MNTNLRSPEDNSQDIAPERIARLLTRATQQLDENTAAALRRVRNIALERQAPGKPAFALSAGHGLHWPIPHFPHQWVAAVILLAAILLGGVSYWEHAHEDRMGRLDAAILADELPLEVFID